MDSRGRFALDPDDRGGPLKHNSIRRGLTLLELMIALVLTSIVGYMAFRLFRDEHVNYTRTREKVSLQSDAREAVRLMEEEIKNMGFRMATTLSGTSLTLSECDEAIYSGTSGAAFETPAAGQIEFRFFNPYENFTCGVAERYTIAYRLVSGKILERAVWKGDKPTDPDDINWVPFLAGVTQFEVQYGTVSPRTQFIETADLTSTNPPTLFTLTNTTIAVDQTTSDRPWHISEWNSNKGYAILQKDLVMKAKSTYRISFWADASPAFRSGREPNSTGMVLNASGADKVFISFDPGDEAVPRLIQYDFSPPADGTYRLGVTSEMVADPASPADCWLDLASIQLMELSQGEYSGWSTAPATPTAVGAVRLLLQVQGPRGDQLSFDRIIPVVNNALNY